MKSYPRIPQHTVRRGRDLDHFASEALIEKYNRAHDQRYGWSWAFPNVYRRINRNPEYVPASRDLTPEGIWRHHRP